MSFTRILFYCLSAISSLLIVALVIIIYATSHLPSVDQLTETPYQVPLKIFTSDHKLIGLYGEKYRKPVSLAQIPKTLQEAFIAIEDQRFFSHMGVDPVAVMRAVVKVVSSGHKSQGGSTITMQVARNFFLSANKTYLRKFNETLLAVKIERMLSKEAILQLYLNKIYLGNRAYGVGAAAEIYYGKTMNELTLAECAMLASLPKAPSKINPVLNKKLAIERRNHVLTRMQQEGYISEEAMQQAKTEPDNAYFHGIELDMSLPHVSESVRQMMLQELGPRVYTDGYEITTTINSQLQQQAQEKIHNRVLEMVRERKHDRPINIGDNRFLPAHKWLSERNAPMSLNKNFAVVMHAYNNHAIIKLANEQWVSVDIQDSEPGDLLQKSENGWQKAQYDQPQAAFLLMDAHTGAILAMVGSAEGKGGFNRATQAKRQVGSTFKPILYSAALERGMTLASIVNDAPYVSKGGDSELLWRPDNHDLKFSGPIRLRQAMISSRNLVSVRLLEMIGIQEAKAVAEQFGLNQNLQPNDLSLSLGSGLASVTEISSAFTTFANRGQRSLPYLVESIHNQHGQRLILTNTKVKLDDVYFVRQANQPLLKPKTAFLMYDLLHDVVQSGTAKQLKRMKRYDLAGKTGTTNGLRDAWFVGFNGQYVATVWLGYDRFFSLRLYSSGSATPLWADIMSDWLKDKPEAMPERPSDIITLRIDAKTGQQLDDPEQKGIFEIFDLDNLQSVTSEFSGSFQAKRSAIY